MSGSGVRDHWGHVGRSRHTWVLSPSSASPLADHADAQTISISDLSWTRFGSLISLRSKSRVSVVLSGNGDTPARVKRKHLEIDSWLRALDLEQYLDDFTDYQGVEDLIDFSEADIKELGVKISSHRTAIMSSLTMLRSKYYNGNGTETLARRQPSSRHSVAVDSHKKIFQEETKSDLKDVYEAIRTKSLKNFVMEPCADPSMDVVALKKALEWELSLDGRDLRSHAWYHGAIPRIRAEEIVRDDGSFLVRDCTSQPGNYVLTCRRNQQALHFVISRQILQPDTVYERVQYQFEDDPFDTVPDLITSYVGSGRPITVLSGARIQTPVNRMYPLSFYATKYPSSMYQSRMSSPATTPMGNSSFRYPMQICKPASPNRNSKDAPPRLPSKKQRSQSLTPAEVNRMAQEKCNSADGVIQSPLMTRSTGNECSKFSSQSLPRNSCARLSISPSSVTLGRNSKLNRVLSDNSEDENLPESPPPKPSRIPYNSKDSDLDPLQRVTSYHTSGSDSGNGSGDSTVSSDPVEPPHRSGVVIKNPRYNMSASESTSTLKNHDFDYVAAEEKLMQMPQPELDLSTQFDLENFQTILLPVSENKPLDGQALRGIKITLKEAGSRILATHLTKVDLEILGMDKSRPQSKLGNGLELCTLPHGHQFRLDLIERTECLKLLVAITILTCYDEDDRAETLNKWIEIAIDTKAALGNLYGFCGIMLGLCLPQIQKLDTTWHKLRQKYTDSAFNFEAKLRPTLKNMNSCSNPQAPNTTIPHLLPFILLLERNLDDFITPSFDQNSLAVNCLGLWETNTQDFGLSTLLAHMDSARKFVNLSQTFQRNADIVLAEARLDEIATDMFKTEFHLKFLWGSRGAYAMSYDRHSKFEQVLNVMAEKYCNNIKEESEV
ncbi:PREDICTED: breast cancer anti-estrogen resistance protein 3 isoform X2 [Nicrophorus vespilloides]|uniref:Breast cancer anti-estrogen resistance protein 3 isoform X2 n=1 Tax=Nicrophorus vespilloides TaxID=110193 RepID=A0ABM1N0M3_NICVS|nr:PREDICTED: breast cancer anti-estrogen resistance protein 3 isoform X2 [Nicrophorus vespilloides]